MSTENILSIVEFRAENVKRLKAVRIQPDGQVVVIGGRNAQGKSSVLDAITMALAGGNAVCDKPIREGTKKASVELDLGELKIQRSFTSKGTYLKVTDKDGAAVKSAQGVLDKLVGKTAIDPIAFANAKPAEQSEIAKQVMGLDFADLDEARETFYNKRRDINRDYRSAQEAAKQIEVAPIVNDELVDTEAIGEKLNKAFENNAAITKLEATIERKLANWKSLDERILSITQQIDALQRELKTATVEVDNLSEEIETHKAELDETEKVDVHEVQRQVTEAQRRNQKIADARKAKTEKDKWLERARELDENSRKLTSDIEALDDKKLQRIAAAKMPVEGLSFDDFGQLTLKGIPFSQASHAEKLRVSVAMALASNPRIRVVLIRDGSVLDDEGLELVAKFAAEHSAQLWIERVGKGEECSLIIEDGEVIEERTKQEVTA